MGRFELFTLSADRRRARSEPQTRPAAPSAAYEIVQTVIWAEARQITICGDLDRSGADALRSVLVDTVGSGLPCIVLDLSRCRSLDAAALSVVLEIEVELEANGQELMVDGATGQVERLIAGACDIPSRVRIGS
jgi:anti-anti-sigma factor